MFRTMRMLQGALSLIDEMAQGCPMLIVSKTASDVENLAVRFFDMALINGYCPIIRNKNKNGYSVSFPELDNKPIFNFARIDANHCDKGHHRETSED